MFTISWCLWVRNRAWLDGCFCLRVSVVRQCGLGLQSHRKARGGQDPHSGSLVWLAADSGLHGLLVGHPYFLAPWAAPLVGSLPSESEGAKEGEKGSVQAFCHLSSSPITFAIFSWLEACLLLIQPSGRGFQQCSTGKWGSLGPFPRLLPPVWPQWLMSLPPAEHAHSLPGSPVILSHYSISSKSRILSSKPGPGGDEALGTKNTA